MTSKCIVGGKSVLLLGKIPVNNINRWFGGECWSYVAYGQIRVLNELQANSRAQCDHFGAWYLAQG